MEVKYVIFCAGKGFYNLEQGFLKGAFEATRITNKDFAVRLADTLGGTVIKLYDPVNIRQCKEWEKL